MATTSTTNLDVNSIVTQLMTVERQPIAKLDAKEAGNQVKLTAYASVKGALSSFQTAVQGLSSASKFTALNATTSDDTVLSATASSIAVAGSYSLEVSSLAQGQKLVAAGQSSSTASIGDGTTTTVTFDFGTISGTLLGSGKYDTGTTFLSNGKGVKSITIGSSNNSLQGIRDTINAAKIGVTATIVNDGSSTPYRLALSSDNQGASNSLKISVSGDANVGALLAHDPASALGQNLAETITASNAALKVNGVAVSKDSNSISDVIQGVTINLKTKNTSPTTLTVAHDNASISNSVTGFVKAYNDLSKILSDISAYDPKTKTGAILQGDGTIRTLKSQLRSALGSSVVGASGDLTTLSQIGVSFQKDGTIALDSTKLNSAMESNINDIASLFAAAGGATDSLVSFTSATSSTSAGNYPVNITQLATQGKVVGSGTANTTITAANKDLNIIVNGTSASVSLTVGTYTAQALTAELQAQINGANSFSNAGISVAVTQSGGVFTVTSSSYGSSSSVSIGGSGADSLLGTTPTATSGVDVAGTIGGVTGTGAGQILSYAQGLSITVNGGALGGRGTVSYSNGYAFLLDKWAGAILTTSGAIQTRTDGIRTTIKSIGQQRDAINTRLVSIEKRYRAQFTHLDATLNSMNATSTYLTQQLNQISKL
jgi:flagellar hook-associated protein 2